MGLPLFDRFAKTRALPRVALSQLPTPVVGLAVPGVAGAAVKRDDLTSALYGGNKVRKLEFALGEALAENRRAVITFGAYGSNHALATAVHACALGLEPHAVLSPQAPGPFAAATLRAHAGLGTVIHPVDGWDGAREAVRAKAELAKRDGIEPLVIPMGGTSGMGAAGYVSAAFEVLDQAACGEADVPDVVYVAAGTLGTMVGLAIGFRAAGASTRVVGVRVTPDSVASESVARRVTDETVTLLRSFDDSFPALAYDDLAAELRDDWFEPGYGIVTPETTAAVTSAAEQGVKLETTYTGKAYAAMLADAARGALDGAYVLFWDTYNSAPMPAAGPVERLPEPLRDYVETCDALFSADTEGDS
jgi:D-cysteine desulfhydrase